MFEFADCFAGFLCRLKHGSKAINRVLMFTSNMFTSEADFERADWPHLQNGAVSFFWRPEILAEARQSLVVLDYDVSEVMCGVDVPSFEVQMSRALLWREQFGYEPWTGNLDAFNDALRYVPFSPSGRRVLVLTGFHHIVAADSERAYIMLDLIEAAARDHLLESMLLIALIQTDDPHYSCDPVGGRLPRWNWREWDNSARGL